MQKFDVIVVGGGMVGASVALSLAEQGLTIAVIEKQQPSHVDDSAPYNLRVSAISLGSEQLLKQLDVWQHIVSQRHAPYRKLAIWESDYSYTEFDAASISQPHLGHIIENHVIQHAIWQKLSGHNNVQLFVGESVTALVQDNKQCNIQLSNSEHMSAKLLLAADGAHSTIRQLANIGTTGWDYQQSAMLINVETEYEQQDITWQYMTPQGPRAFLPLQHNQASLVWYDSPDKIKQLLSLNNQQLTDAVEATFPSRLGKVSVIDKGAFPNKATR